MTENKKEITDLKIKAEMNRFLDSDDAKKYYAAMGQDKINARMDILRSWATKEALELQAESDRRKAEREPGLTKEERTLFLDEGVVISGFRRQKNIDATNEATQTYLEGIGGLSANYKQGHDGY